MSAPILIALAACGGSSDKQPPAAANGLELVVNAKLGSILADGNGRTLYYFSRDLPAGGGNSAVSNCAGSAADANSCVHDWPIFHAANPALGAGVNAADVGEITRADGLKQTTFKGFPLYFFVHDVNAGDVNGESVEDWFVLRSPFYSVLTLDSGTTRLTNAAGRSLYAFSHDTVGMPPVSACNGTAGDRTTCIGKWPIFFAGDAVVAPTGVDPQQFTTFTRADGQKQTAFKGHPLYYFVDDAAPGDQKGLAIAPGVWTTVDPAKQ